MKLKSCFVEGSSLDDVYFLLLSELYKHGRVNDINEGSFKGAKRLEFDFVAGTINYPSTRPLAPIFPPNTPPVTNDEEINEYWTNYIMDGVNLAENEHYRYSTWISGGPYKLPKVSFVGSDSTNNETIIMNVPDQTQWCIDHYKKKGFGNNHCYIQIGYPESSFAYDVPYKEGEDRQTSPCLRGIDTHIKDNKLCFAVVFRSWDLFAGFPTNMGGLVLHMEYMANELGIEVGALSFSSLKLHVYDFELDLVSKRLNI